MYMILDSLPQSTTSVKIAYFPHATGDCYERCLLIKRLVFFLGLHVDLRRVKLPQICVLKKIQVWGEEEVSDCMA